MTRYFATLFMAMSLGCTPSPTVETEQTEAEILMDIKDELGFAMEDIDEAIRLLEENTKRTEAALEK